MVERLIDKGMAYAAGGDVYYRVEKFPGYGKLCKRNLEEMQAGARIAPGEQKRNPMDFALWKAAKPGEPAGSALGAGPAGLAYRVLGHELEYCWARPSISTAAART